jgi:hypothetical protein
MNQPSTAGHPILNALRIPAALAFLGGAFFSVPAFQESVCSQSVVTAHEAVAQKVCFYKTSWRATAADATTLIDDFLAEAGGARPASAWRYLSDDYQKSTGKADFVKNWTPIVFAERLPTADKVAAPERLNSNTWYFTYRIFTGDGVNPPRSGLTKTLNADITIVYDSTGRPRIADLNDEGRAAEDTRVTYFRDFVREQTVTRTLPALRAHAAQNLAADDTVRILCQLISDDGENWVRTSDGWLPVSVLRRASTENLAAPTCGPDHEARARRL